MSDRTKMRSRLWGYGYADLALLLGVREQTVRLWVSQGKLNPADLLALLKFAVRKNPALLAVLLTPPSTE